MYFYLGPNEDIRIEKNDKFFNELQSEIDRSNIKVRIMGDLNGRVGNKNAKAGKQREHVKNTIRERIIKLSLENELRIRNIHLKHKEIGKIAREAPSRNKSQ